MNNILSSVKFPNSQTKELFELVLTQKPKQADAIIWLQGDRLDRAEKVCDLFFNKLATKIVVTGNNILIGKGPRPGEEDIHLDEILKWLKQEDVPREAVVLDDQALNSSEQARNVIKIAKESNWQKILLVSSPYHQLRAFLVFLKQVEEQQAKVEIINQSALNLAWDHKAGGRPYTMKELVPIELKKIAKYSHYLATVAEGLEYLKSASTA